MAERPLPSGNARLAYPPNWRLTGTDPGTVTATLHRNGQIAGYLNIIPQSGAESLTSWASFRPEHNREDGDRDLRPLSSATGVHFRDGTGSCVQDAYTTSTNHHYREIACIVRGPDATTVIVAWAPPNRWAQLSSTLEQAVSSFEARGKSPPAR